MAIEHVLDLLATLDKPRNALATAVQQGLSERPGENFLSGLGEGWDQSVHTSWGDLIGIPETSPDDTWAEYLGKGGARLVTDAILDPLNILLFLKPLQTARKLAPYQKASEWAHGTGLGKAFLSSVPKHREDDVLLPFLAAQRGRRESIEEILPAMKSASEGEAAFVQNLIDSGAGPIEAQRMARQMWERHGGEAMPVDYTDPAGLLKGRSRSLVDEINAITTRMGADELITPITESPVYPNFVPRVENKTGKRAMGGGGISPSDVGASRELMRWVDPEALSRGELLDTEFGKIVTKEAHPLGGVKRTDTGTFEFTDPKTGKTVQVAPTQVTLPEMIGEGVANERHFVMSAVDSYKVDILKKEGHKAFLIAVEKGLTDLPGALSGGGWLTKVSSKEELGQLPKNWRTLKVTGMENFAAPKDVANFIEKQTHSLWPQNSPLGSVMHFGDLVMGSKVGQAIQDTTQWWKRNALAHPAYVIGNRVSDLGLMYTAEVPVWALPARIMQAGVVQAGWDGVDDVIKGIKNSELRHQLEIRGMSEATQAQEGVRGIVSKIEDVGRIKARSEAWKASESGVKQAAGKALEPVSKVADKWSKWNDIWLEKINRPGEENGRIAVAIDWLKRNVDGKPTAVDLDRAVAFATRAMIDYANRGGAQRFMSMLMPFYSWTHGILGRAAEVALEHPERLARLGRALDTMFTPATNEDKALMDPWMREQAPVTGFMGKEFEATDGGPAQLLLSRGIAFADVEKMFRRPTDTILSGLTPVMKSPLELMSNWSYFKKRPIDELSGGFPDNILNPVLGGPHEMATEKPLGMDVSAMTNYLMSQAPGGRMAKTVSEVARGFGAFEDPYKAETSPGEALTWAATGGRYYPFDAAKARHRKQVEERKVTANIKQKLKLAVQKGDAYGVEHYLNEMARHREDYQRAMGYVEGGG